jgi:hypothetical protein
MSENENVVHQGTAVLVQQRVERLPLAEVKTACNYVKQLLDDVMKEDLHYGTIPGCGKKRALFKAGADKIKQALNLYPEFEGWDSPIDLGDGHVAYRIKTTMRTIIGNVPVATGIGYCSSMEKKYRYTVGELTSTGNPVPPDYWTFRKTDPAKALKLIGGEGFRVKKITSSEGAGHWEICIAGEPMERIDIADVHNTVLKMAKKRSYVDCAITAASASDLLEQDTINEDDMTLEDGGGATKNNREPNPKADAKPAPVKDKPANQPPDKGLSNEASAGRLDVFDTLEKELREFCDGDDAKMQGKLAALTSFIGKDKETGKPKEVVGVKFVSDLRMKDKTSWAGLVLKKLRDEVAGER